MKKLFFVFVLLLNFVFVQCAAFAQENIAPCFSPGDKCTAIIVAEIDRAAQEIMIQTYVLTSRSIADALIRAAKRNVEVNIVLDGKSSQSKNSLAKYIKYQSNSTIKLFLDKQHAIQHNKTIIIDGKVLITGSFNFSKAAENSNAENLVVIWGHEDLTIAFMNDFELHRSHSFSF